MFINFLINATKDTMKFYILILLSMISAPVVSMLNTHAKLPKTVVHPVSSNIVNHSTIFHPEEIKTIIADFKTKDNCFITVSRTITDDASEPEYEGSIEIRMQHESLSPKQSAEFFKELVKEYNLFEQSKQAWLEEAKQHRN